LISSYLEALDRGEPPDREALIRENPEHAAGLRAFFADLDRFPRLPGQAVRSGTETAAVESREPLPGSLIAGRYKLIESIGEGGMGSVWMAEQRPPLKRKVAIKLVKAGMDSRLVLARFEAERQALAVMDHPNIAKVFDGGLTEQGRPFFAMEYVKGIPFTEYCDRARLPLRERLALFVPVCSAVQHAHQKGIVHRDLKPSNVLVCLYDGRPVPKVIDFGLAKALHQPLTDRSIYTGHGVVVGTPLYMSPEQAEQNNLDVDTRTDIYSLGVVLYELLTGTTPLEKKRLEKAAYDEVLRLIKEEEPPRPSVRLSGSDRLPALAAQRNIDPRRLQKLLAGDLDWIVMKSLEKERSRRYETASGLARDIERFLGDEAVEACPPSAGYRMRKFVRKHRGQVIAVAAVFAALVAGIIAATWGLLRARVAEVAAGESERQAVASEKKALGALEELKSERDRTEKSLALGVLRPLGFGDDPGEAELRAFADWSALADSRLQLRILEEAFQDPATALRVARRADRVVQACVGLSPQRKKKALELVAAKQRDRQADPRVRGAACWLALELGSADLPALEESIAWLGDARNKLTGELSELVNFAAARMSPQQVAQVGSALIAVLHKPQNSMALKAPGDGLAELAPRLAPEQVTRGGDALIAVLQTSQDSWALSAAGKGLAALAPRLAPEQVARGGDALIAVFQKSQDSVALWAAGEGLAALAPRLAPEQVARGGDALIAVLQTSRDSNAWGAERGLANLAPRLAPEQAARGCDALIVMLQTSQDWLPLLAAGEGLAALAPRLTPEQAARCWDALIAVFQKSQDSDALEAAGNGLAALSPRLASEQVTRSGDALIAVLHTSQDWRPLLAAGMGLAALAPRLAPEQAARGWDALIAVLQKSLDEDALLAAGNGLAALAPRLAPEQVARGCDALIAVLPTLQDRRALSAAGKGLAALAPRLAPEQVTRGGDALIAVLHTSQDWRPLLAAGMGLAALAPRLAPEQAARGWDALIAVLQKSQDSDALEAAGNGLAALAPRLAPEEVTRGWDALIAVLQKSQDSDALKAAGIGLAALAPRLAPEQVARVWDALIAVLQKSQDSNAIEAAGEGLAALAPRLAPEQRLRAAECLLAALHSTLGPRGVELIARTIPLLEAKRQDSIFAEAMTVLLNYAALSSTYLEIDWETGPLGTCVRAVIAPRSLAWLLSHPGCVGWPREWLLQRFEELLFHNRQAVYLKPETKKDPAASPQAPAAPPPPPRRFRDLPEAAAWIAENWPDFDLEANHPAVWRGRR